ncbi:MAG: glutathione peroxidase [Gemmatimonadota bacterium]
MTPFDFTVTAADGTPQALDSLRGQALLIVNVASECSYTQQYPGLEALHRTYHARGFSVLGFPCNQFGGQEPGTAADIAEFCTVRFQTTFPILAKINVNGDDADPLWSFLKQERPGILGTTAIKWNFTKFLVSPTGVVVKRYGPETTPEAIAPDIVAVIAGP